MQVSLAALAGGVVELFRADVARLVQLPPWNVDLQPGVKVGYFRWMGGWWMEEGRVVHSRVDE